MDEEVTPLESPISRAGQQIGGGAPRSSYSTFFILLYLGAPILFVPIWAYRNGHLWLLLGIAASYLSTGLSAAYSRAIFYFTCYCVGFWIHNGLSIYNYTTFYYFCSLFGFTLWQLAEAAQAGRILLVMCNIILEAVTYTFGLLTGSIGAAIAYYKGIETVTPDKADALMRQLKKGTAGLGMILLGYLAVHSIFVESVIGGYMCVVLLWILVSRKLRQQGLETGSVFADSNEKIELANDVGGGTRARDSKNSEDLKKYEGIVFAFSGLIAVHSPLIGDCSKLPYPKALILYAIKWVTDEYEAKRQSATSREYCDAIDEMIGTLNYLLTRLAREWHEIDPADKDAIVKLGGFKSFPDWALPLKMKYINDEKASHEAFDAALAVMKDKSGR